MASSSWRLACNAQFLPAEGLKQERGGDRRVVTQCQGPPRAGPRDVAEASFLLEGANGVPNMVVFTDGFPDEPTANAECQRFKAVASQCIVQRGVQ